MLACTRVNPEVIYGKYVATYPFGNDTLTLGSDGHFGFLNTRRSRTRNADLQRDMAVSSARRLHRVSSSRLHRRRFWKTERRLAHGCHGQFVSARRTVVVQANDKFWSAISLRKAAHMKSAGGPAGRLAVAFSGSTLAGIFLGKITKWNDPAIADDNPGVNLPAIDIKVRHEFPNGSVETRVIADYLSKESPAFKTAVASPPGADWPLASCRNYKGAEGTAGFVSQTPGSFGYLPLAIAHAQSREGSLKCAAVKNSDGELVTASPESITAASASAKIQPPDFRVSGFEVITVGRF